MAFQVRKANISDHIMSLVGHFCNLGLKRNAVPESQRDFARSE